VAGVSRGDPSSDRSREEEKRSTMGSAHQDNWARFRPIRIMPGLPCWVVLLHHFPFPSLLLHIDMARRRRGDAKRGEKWRGKKKLSPIPSPSIAACLFRRRQGRDSAPPPLPLYPLWFWEPSFVDPSLVLRECKNRCVCLPSSWRFLTHRSLFSCSSR